MKSLVVSLYFTNELKFSTLSMNLISKPFSFNPRGTTDDEDNY